MERPRSVAPQFPVIAISIVALVSALGRSACAAAHVGGSQAGTASTAIRTGHHSTSAAEGARITWLTLRNGWHSENQRGVRRREREEVHLARGDLVPG